MTRREQITQIIETAKEKVDVDPRVDKRAAIFLAGEIWFDLEVDFSEYNNGIHQILEFSGIIVDFWPTTGKWSDRSDRGPRRGIATLIRFILETREKEKES